MNKVNREMDEKKLFDYFKSVTRTIEIRWTGSKNRKPWDFASRTLLGTSLQNYSDFLRIKRLREIRKKRKYTFLPH